MNGAANALKNAAAGTAGEAARKAAEAYGMDDMARRLTELYATLT